MSTVFFILFTLAEITLVVLTFTGFSEKTAWLKNRTLIRTIETFLLFVMVLVPATHMKWRYAAALTVLFIRLLISCIAWIVNRKKAQGRRGKAVTVVSCILSIIFMVFALISDDWARIVALVVFIIAAITDKIDGIWARKSKHVTDLGAFLDPLADKMLVNLAFLVLVYLGIVPLWVFAVILVRDFAVDGMRMMLARSGITLAASFLGKLKTTVQMTALITILANQVLHNDIIAVLGNIALYLALFLTILSGADYLIQGWRQISTK